MNFYDFVQQLDFVSIFYTLDVYFLASCVFFFIIFYVHKKAKYYKYYIEKQKLI